MVNGTIYHVDNDGKITDVKEADSAKLLSTKYWTTNKAGDAAATRVVRREAYKAQAQLITRTGGVIDRNIQPEVPAAMPLPLNVAANPPVSSELEFPTMRAQPAPAPVAVAPGAAEPTPVSEPTEAGEWPDPNMTMPKPQLLEMAKAYGVVNAAPMTKAQLVSAITEAMYG
jgi:hypothetical protein